MQLLLCNLNMTVHYNTFGNSENSTMLGFHLHLKVQISVLKVYSYSHEQKFLIKPLRLSKTLVSTERFIELIHY